MTQLRKNTGDDADEGNFFFFKIKLFLLQWKWNINQMQRCVFCKHCLQFFLNHTTRVDRCRLLRWKHNIIVLTSQEGHLRDLYNLDQSVADHQDLGFGMDRWKCQQALDWKLGMDSIWIPGMEIWIRWNYQCGQVLLCVKYSHPSMDLFTKAWIFQQTQWLTLWWCQYLDILEVLMTFVCDGENCKNASSDLVIDQSSGMIDNTWN